MSKKQKKALFEIIISAVLFSVGLLSANSLVKAAFYIAAYLAVGAEVLYKAIRKLFGGQMLDECFLMSLATIGAFAIGKYPEAVAVMLFYQIGELFQSLAVGKSRKSIAALMDIRPETARILRGGREITASPEEIKIGDILLVRPGERIPTDGIITEGTASVDTSCMTGESLPVSKLPGDAVMSGTVNTDGVISVRATAIYRDSAVSKILKLVESTSATKAKTENFITRFARYYTPAVVIGALLLFLIPFIFTGEWKSQLNRSLVFLVVSCPCALVISVPLSFFGGIGGCSKKGILVKGAVNLETLAKTDTVLFDKTGTLTYGEFHIESVLPNGISEERLLGITAAAEACSNHPVARCIAIKGEKFASDYSVSNVKELSGKGISAEIDGEYCFFGNSVLMAENGISVPSAPHYGTAIYAAANGNYIGCITVADKIKENAEAVIGSLHGLGIKKAVMLTGDGLENSSHTAELVKTDGFYAQLLPEEKLKKLKEIKSEGSTAIFVGDGINDAPVLTAADVGIAMGALGSDAAIEAADIVITDDNLSKIPTAVNIARKTMSIVKQNIVFALLVKGIILLLGALGAANMWLAVFGDVGVTVLAILNAMRTLQIKAENKGA